MPRKEQKDCISGLVPLSVSFVRKGERILESPNWSKVMVPMQGRKKGGLSYKVAPALLNER